MKKGLLGIILCGFFVGPTSTQEMHLSNSRKLLKRDEITGKMILYEFEDINWDGNVEVCISGDPEREIKIYAYLSREHSEFIRSFNGGDFGNVAGYAPLPWINGTPIKKMEVIVMNDTEQDKANYLYTLAR